jgi:hypothetical protein
MYKVDPRQFGVRMLLLASLVGCVLLVPSSAGASPGAYSQAQVDAAIASGVANIDPQQNPDGSFGSSYLVAETGTALASYGVMANGNFSSLPASYQTHALSAIAWLLNEQDATSGGWLGYSTYYTGQALTGLSFFKDQPGVQASIDKGRAFLVSSQKAPPNFNCNPGPDFDWCGGWDYDKSSSQRSDQSNTGFALTGLELTGGVSPADAGANSGWQRNVQELSSNPHATLNNGGGSYEPGETYTGFRSNANDTGSLLFGYGYDGVPAGDAGVQAAMAFANQAFDQYELMAGSAQREMIANDGVTLGSPCAIGSLGCDWFIAGDGGYHYSIFAMSKGIGQYTVASLTDSNNFYAKVVDLLLGEQAPDGSWPQDDRDDGSPLMATGFAVLSLGKVGQKPVEPAAAAAAPAAAKAVAKASIRGPGKCTRSSAIVRVSGQNISTVTYSLDGKRIKKAKGNKTSVKVNLRHKKSGVHRVTAKVSFTSATAAKAQTKRFSVSRCARKAARPKFTG